MSNKNISKAAVTVLVAAIAAAKVYHFVVHPEWTEAQALVGLWPAWVVVAAAFTIVAVLAMPRKEAEASGTCGTCGGTKRYGRCRYETADHSDLDAAISRILDPPSKSEE